MIGVPQQGRPRATAAIADLWEQHAYLVAALAVLVVGLLGYALGSSSRPDSSEAAHARLQARGAAFDRAERASFADSRAIGYDQGFVAGNNAGAAAGENKGTQAGLTQLQRNAAAQQAARPRFGCQNGACFFPGQSQPSDRSRSDSGALRRRNSSPSRRSQPRQQTPPRRAPTPRPSQPAPQGGAPTPQNPLGNQVP